LEGKADTVHKEDKVMKRQNVSPTGRRTAEGNAAKDAAKDAPTPEEIRQRAFEIHVERGGIHGYDLDDWLQAERELQNKYRSSKGDQA
jgi:hypothetical protein